MSKAGVSRRSLLKGAVASGAIAFPMINRGMFQVHAAIPKSFPKRTVDLIQSSIVIDMLGPLSLDLRPETVATKLTEAQVADFRKSGITAFHNSFGIGGREAYSEVLEFLAGWGAFVGHN